MTHKRFVDSSNWAEDVRIRIHVTLYNNNINIDQFDKLANSPMNEFKYFLYVAWLLN